MTHALRVTEGSAAFRSLYAAIEREGERAGWLDLSALSSAPTAGEARDGGSGAGLDDDAWKAVAVEVGRTVAIKRRRGAPVLRDLMREHFSGCRVVLVRGEAALPLLRSHGEDWEIEDTGGESRRLTTSELVRALRSPRLGT